MAENMPKFEGDILDIGNDYFLVKKSVVFDWLEQTERLEKDLREMQVKPVRKKTGVVAGKEGRNEVLNSTQKGQILELRNKGYSLRQIAEVFGVSHETVRKVESEIKSEPKSAAKELPKANVFGTQISEDFTVRDGVTKISSDPREL